MKQRYFGWLGFQGPLNSRATTRDFRGRRVEFSGSSTCDLASDRDLKLPVTPGATLLFPRVHSMFYHTQRVASSLPPFSHISLCNCNYLNYLCPPTAVNCLCLSPWPPTLLPPSRSVGSARHVAHHQCPHELPLTLAALPGCNCHGGIHDGVARAEA